MNTTAPKEKKGYTGLLNKSLGIFFSTAWHITLRRPSQAWFFFRTVRWQRRAAKVRGGLDGQGVHVPPIIIYSITERCNLHCKGCYAQALHDAVQPEMSAAKMRETIREARELGVSFMVLAGGEPLVRREILDIIREFRDVIFFVFTNGTLIDVALADHMKHIPNLVPILSLEGNRAETDLRRGSGVFQNLTAVIRRLKQRHIFFGTSITLTQSNFNTVTESSLVRDLHRSGCRLFFFIEYTPIDAGTESWEVTAAQRETMVQKVAAFRKDFPALFVNLPDDEKDFGGCLSSGRGFVHISAQGNVEPCPFAPYSDTNVRDTSLKESLRSRFLATVRDNSDQLHESSGGCALWREKEWLQSVLNEQKQTDKETVKEPAKDSAAGLKR
ncbi:MAG: radical SAM protein [Dehalococcoidales bacterium]|jgi:MoaA/NifB/PqqE/SkfB family radical SAM enzyme